MRIEKYKYDPENMEILDLYIRIFEYDIRVDVRKELAKSFALSAEIRWR